MTKTLGSVVTTPRRATAVGVGSQSVPARLEVDAEAPVFEEDGFCPASGVVAIPVSPDLEEVAIPLTRPRARVSQTRLREDRMPTWAHETSTLGGFELLDVIGGGGTSNVFLAQRVEDRGFIDAPRYAVKVPDFETIAARGEDARVAAQLFREELATLLMLPPHDNIARLVAFDGGGPRPFVAMELVEGTACDVLLREQALSVERALDVLDGVLGALETMHALGIGHLDLKPSNVVVTDDGCAVLVDFGLAGPRIRPTFLTGSYGAPEVWSTHEARLASPPTADMYSFGCVAYELLAGETLFDAPTMIALILAHANHDGAPPGIVRLAEVAPDLADVLARCLRHTPADRATASEVRAELRRIRGELVHHAWPL